MLIPIVINPDPVAMNFHPEDAPMNARLISAAALTLVLSACATGPGYYERGPGPGYYGPPPPPPGAYNMRCRTCGRVDRIEQVYGDRRSSGTGAVVGGIVGGVLGNTVGKGDGRTAATVVGAVGGAVVGNEIEKNNNGGTSYDVYVRMDNGRRVILNQRELGGIREGSYVDIEGNRAHLIR